MSTPRHKFRPQRDCDRNGNTNSVRADRAMQAVQAYRKAGGYKATDDNEEPMHDLLNDMMHLADKLGLDFEAMLKSATSSYTEER